MEDASLLFSSPNGQFDAVKNSSGTIPGCDPSSTAAWSPRRPRTCSALAATAAGAKLRREEVRRSCKQREAGALAAATEPSAHGSTMAEGGGSMRCGVRARPASPASLARSPQALLHDAGARVR